jgi:hypothetical protein
LQILTICLRRMTVVVRDCGVPGLPGSLIVAAAVLRT